ncbi:putative alternative RNA polymerase sigma factor [Mycobacterium ulcerans str. Harvey]|uniref:Alternative RNA polymerase sigma factor n=1 Tax=Mycobacterium ulcerans str. Harvey TaxID=1299332 RepID=A0ABN0QZB0_MYCUL|nr:putative alternative RNA polymerase sigma factor [Mycobacterium ulcerans str. Harvey]
MWVNDDPDRGTPEPTSEHMVGGIPLASLVRDYHRQMVNFARTMVEFADDSRRSGTGSVGAGHPVFGLLRGAIVGGNLAIRHR